MIKVSEVWRVAKNVLDKCVLGVHFSSFVLLRKIHLFSTVAVDVKQAAELTAGVLTQCIRSATIKNLKPATCSNILLKVNSKLNGMNHKLASVSK
jgi:hypothetical protein